MSPISMLRRPSYSALSLALRAVGSSSTAFHRAISTVPTSTPDLIRTSSFPSRRFSTATATEPIAEESLVELLQSQIKSSRVDIYKNPEVPDKFPFELIDNPGESTIFLKREFEGENIQVGVDIPHIIHPDWDNYDKDHDDEYDISNDNPGIPMVVSIAKENGLQLEFGVTGFEEEVFIDSLSVKQPELSLEKIVYDGPEFLDLGENLQNAFYKYLEVRGITHDLTVFLYDYMRKKNGKECMKWLKNVKAFIEQ